MTTLLATERAASSTLRDVDDSDELSKVPQVTLAFWVVKIFATTLGETGGDALSMQLNLGYAVSTLIFLAFFLVTLAAQVRSKHYHPLFYWAVVVATTTVGTTTSDYFDRTLGLGYVKSSAILLALVIAMLFLWRRTTGAIRVDHITTRKDEIFYWVTILLSPIPLVRRSAISLRPPLALDSRAGRWFSRASLHWLVSPTTRPVYQPAGCSGQPMFLPVRLARRSGIF